MSNGVVLVAAAFALAAGACGSGGGSPATDAAAVATPSDTADTAGDILDAPPPADPHPSDRSAAGGDPDEGVPPPATDGPATSSPDSDADTQTQTPPPDSATPPPDSATADAAAPEADGGPAASCHYYGKTFPEGSPVPDIEKCNLCVCLASGSVSCTKIACPDGHLYACNFDRTYRFFHDGGLRLFKDTSTLAPHRDHLVTRERRPGDPPVSCTRDLRCHSDAGIVNVTDIMTAIGHPDVVEALRASVKPHHGGDPRPADGVVFTFERDDGRGFILGPGAAVPPGLRALEGLLLTLQTQTLREPACAALAAP